MIAQTDYSISYVRRESPQLFFLFMGTWGQMAGALDFLRASAIGDRNIVLLKDPHIGQCYLRGISGEYDSLDGIVRWQREQLAELFPHVRDVFCAGTSAGAGAAIHTGCRLRARAAVSLGGRFVNPDVIERRERVSNEFYRKVLGDAADRPMTEEDRLRLVEAFKDPDVRRLRWDLSGNPETVAAREQVRSLVQVVNRDANGTDFHFYYATSNEIDREFAQAFKDCPNTQLHPLTPPATDWSQDISFSDPDHAVVKILHETGQLRDVFAAYV